MQELVHFAPIYPPPSLSSESQTEDLTVSVSTIFDIIRIHHPQQFLRVIERMPKGGILQMDMINICSPQFLINLATNQSLFFNPITNRFTKEETPISARDIQKYCQQKMRFKENDKPFPLNETLEEIFFKIFRNYTPGNKIICHLLMLLTMDKVIHTIGRMFEKDCVQYIELTIPLVWAKFFGKRSESLSYPKIRYVIYLEGNNSSYVNQIIDRTLEKINNYPNILTINYTATYPVKNSPSQTEILRLLSKFRSQLTHPYLTLKACPNRNKKKHATTADSFSRLINLISPSRIIHEQQMNQAHEIAFVVSTIASKNIAITMSLTENTGFETTGKWIRAYLSNRVPIILHPFNQNPPHTSLGQEFYCAATDYQLNYHELKQFALHSISCSFLPGKSILEMPDGNWMLLKICQGQEVSSEILELLHTSEKAREELDLMDQLYQFERKIVEEFSYLL